MSLTLGTAQWGAGYGLTNAIGRLDDATITAIVRTAQSLGIASVDTSRSPDPALGYGDAQSRLRPWAHDFSITTKVHGADQAGIPIRTQLEASLAELGVDRVDTVLVHDWSILDRAQAEQAVDALAELRDEGRVLRIGVSAYDPHDLVLAAARFEILGAVQLPANVLDQRFAGLPLVAQLHAQGTRVQVRSVFLQGLLLAPDHPSDLARHPDVRRFHEWCIESGLSPLVACLAQVRSLPWADEVLVGVTSDDELAEIGWAWRARPPVADWEELASQDAALIDPRGWNR